MDRLKTFFKYVLLLVGFYLLSNVLISGYLKISYKKITEYEINTQIARVEIIEAKATNRNGIIKGKIINESENIIENQYLKIDLYSERDINLGIRYIKIEKMHPDEQRDFQIDFKVENVVTFKITSTSEMEQNSESILKQIIRGDGTYTL